MSPVVGLLPTVYYFFNITALIEDERMTRKWKKKKHRFHESSEKKASLRDSPHAATCKSLRRRTYSVVIYGLESPSQNPRPPVRAQRWEQYPIHLYTALCIRRMGEASRVLCYASSRAIVRLFFSKRTKFETRTRRARCAAFRWRSMSKVSNIYKAKSCFIFCTFIFFQLL